MTIDLYRFDCVGQSVLLGVGFGLDFLLSLLILRVSIFICLNLWGLLFLLFTFTLDFSQYSLWISSKGEGVELVRILLVKFIKLGKRLEVKLVSGIVKCLMRECIMPLEINTDCDIIRSAGGGNLAPEK